MRTFKKAIYDVISMVIAWDKKWLRACHKTTILPIYCDSCAALLFE